MPNTEGVTFWAFPPALNITFRDALANETRRQHSSISEGVTTDPADTILVSAVHNLTLAQRVDPGFKNEGWGDKNAVVTVGDVIELDWRGTENRTVILDCMTCEHGAKGGSIENACENYTKSTHTAPRDGDGRDNTYAPKQPYTFPSIAFYFPLGDEACALCMFILYSISGNPTIDYSVPFSVLQKPAIPHKRFNAANPTGVEDRSIPTTTVAVLQAPAHDNSSKPNVGMILGVVLGVMGGCGILALLSWFLWRRWWRAKKKVVDSSNSSTADRAEALPAAREGEQNRSTQDIALQRIQGVVRRTDSTRTALPSYHEAIRSGRPQQVG